MEPSHRGEDDMGHTCAVCSEQRLVSAYPQHTVAEGTLTAHSSRWPRGVRTETRTLNFQ